jgi:hypothetical protein
MVTRKRKEGIAKFSHVITSANTWPFFTASPFICISWFNSQVIWRRCINYIRHKAGTKTRGCLSTAKWKLFTDVSEELTASISRDIHNPEKKSVSIPVFRNRVKVKSI